MTVCGTGLGNFPQPGDPDLDNSVLSVSPAKGGLMVSWPYPAINAFAVQHTLLYRNTSATFDTPTQNNPTVVAGNLFYDPLPQGGTYYYWIKLVSVNGTEGALIGPVSDTAIELTTDIMSEPTFVIDSTDLDALLQTAIGNITVNATDIATEAATRAADVAALTTVQTNQATTISDGIGSHYTYKSTQTKIGVATINSNDCRLQRVVCMVRSYPE